MKKPGQKARLWLRVSNQDQQTERTWRLEAADCALAVMQLIEYPKEAHVSRIEMRPAQPNKGETRR